MLPKKNKKTAGSGIFGKKDLLLMLEKGLTVMAEWNTFSIEFRYSGRHMVNHFQCTEAQREHPQASKMENLITIVNGF